MDVSWNLGRPGRSGLGCWCTPGRSPGGDAEPTHPSRTPMGWEGEATWCYANNELDGMPDRRGCNTCEEVQ